MQKPPIILLTDFGIEDTFVGIMKGVILNIAPEANIIDLTHNISPQNIKQAAFLLKTSYIYFPDGSIFVCVVDPGVGSERRPVAIKFGSYYFVAPDNGILSYLYPKNKIEMAINLNNPKFHLKNASSTFHGRDIFAPAAAHIHQGIPLEELGEKISSKSLVKIPKPYFKVDEAVKITGEIIHIDRFGNLITTIEGKYLKDSKFWEVKINDKLISTISTSFSNVEKGNIIAYIGSSGYLEIGIRNGNLAKEENIELNSKVTVIKSK